MTDILERLVPPEVVQRAVLLPGERTITYPGNDAWLELEAKVGDPGADPAWAQVEAVPDSGGKPDKTISTTVVVPQISTTTSVFGGSSLLVGGSGSALTTPDHDDWWFGAGDFTIEGWFRFSVLRKALFAQLDAGETDHGWEFTMDSMAAGLTFFCSTVSLSPWDIQVDRAFVVTVGQWYHLAVVRYGTAIKIFADGVQQGADYAIGSTALRNSGSPLRILGDARNASNDFNGYADELRISKGIARYTANFTPPTAAFTRDQYTVLLMHCDGPNGGTSFTDASGASAAPFDPGSDPAWMEVER